MDRKNEILTGVEVVNRSSDAAIAQPIKGLNNQIGGLPDPEVIVDGKIVTPISALVAASDRLEITSGASEKVFTTDSIVQICEVRNQLLVAKSTDDIEAFEEIKKAA